MHLCEVATAASRFCWLESQLQVLPLPLPLHSLLRLRRRRLGHVVQVALAVMAGTVGRFVRLPGVVDTVVVEGLRQVRVELQQLLQVLFVSDTQTSCCLFRGDLTEQ